MSSDIVGMYGHARIKSERTGGTVRDFEIVSVDESSLEIEVDAESVGLTDFDGVEGVEIDTEIDFVWLEDVV